MIANMPWEAASNAAKMLITRPRPRLALPCSTTVCAWLSTKLAASAGRAATTDSSWRCTSAGWATKP